MKLRLDDSDIAWIGELLGTLFDPNGEAGIQSFIQTGLSLKDFLYIKTKISLGNVVLKCSLDVDKDENGVIFNIVGASLSGISWFGVVRNKANNFIFDSVNKKFQGQKVKCERSKGNLLFKVDHVVFNLAGTVGDSLLLDFNLD
jgi:hypothetical protein